MQTIREILETNAQTALEEMLPLEDLEDGNHRECEKIMKRILTKTYKRMISDVNKEYTTRQSSGSLAPDDEKRFKEFITNFKKNDVEMWIAGASQQEAYDHLPEQEKGVKKEIDEWTRQQDEKHDKYLASAGINTPEGQTAWRVAYHAGYHFKSMIYFDADHERIVCTARESPRRAKTEARIDPSELEKHVGIGIATGILSAQEHELIAKEDTFVQKAVHWLSQEIKQRLDKGLEFNLLDAVSIKKEDDNYVHIRLDKRELYYNIGNK